jgi:hypothetical protein
MITPPVATEPKQEPISRPEEVEMKNEEERIMSGDGDYSIEAVGDKTMVNRRISQVTIFQNQSEGAMGSPNGL